MKFFTVIALISVIALSGAEEFDLEEFAEQDTVKISRGNLDAEVMLDAITDMRTANELFDDDVAKAEFFIKSFKVKHNGNWKLVIDGEPISDVKLPYVEIIITPGSAAGVTPPPVPKRFYVFSCDAI